MSSGSRVARSFPSGAIRSAFSQAGTVPSVVRGANGGPAQIEPCRFSSRTHPLSSIQRKHFSAALTDPSQHRFRFAKVPSVEEQKFSEDTADEKQETRYSEDQLTFWRRVYFGPRIRHSLNLSYSDYELLEWRRVFDAFAAEFETCRVMPVDYVSREIIGKQWRDVFGDNFIRNPSGEAAFGKSPHGLTQNEDAEEEGTSTTEIHPFVTSLTDDGLRVQIDDDALTLGGFSQMVAMKYADVLQDSRDVPGLVERYRREHWITSDFLHFGEFCKIVFLLDAERLRHEMDLDKLRPYFDMPMPMQEDERGVFTVRPGTDVREGARDDPVMTELGLFRLMEETHFTVRSGTDVRRLLRLMDLDGDMMLSVSDLENWLAEPQMYEPSADSH